jgi:predicted dehydrogenase
VWEDTSIDAVDICLPHHLHAPAAIAAMEAGKHVLVEKPIANTVAEAEEMMETAQQTGKVLMVGHMKRFNRAAVTMQRNIASGNIGKPFSFECVWYGPKSIMPGLPWVMKKETGGGGPLMGFGTHHIDLLRWVLGEVSEVSCFTSSAVVKEAEVEDTAVLTLRFRDGAVGVVNFNWARTADDFHELIRIIGTEGEIAVKDGVETTMVSPSRFGDRKTYVLDTAEEAGNLPEEQFLGQLRHFVHCVRSGSTPLTDAMSARNTVAVIEAAYESAAKGRIITVRY